MTKQIENRKSTDMTGDVRPEWAGKGRGDENVGTHDLQIPQIVILQDLSPQIKRTKAEYIEGAEAGQLFNNITNELFSELLVIPVYYRKEYLVWVPRDAGGGFRGSFSTPELASNHQHTLDEKTEIVETAQNFVLVSADKGGTWHEAVIPMSKSALGTARRWNSMVRMKESDRFAQVYRLDTVEKSGTKGDYYGHRITWAGWAQEEWYRLGEETYNAIVAGNCVVSYDSEHGDGGVDNKDTKASHEPDPF